MIGIEPASSWLLDSEEPAIAAMAARDLLGETSASVDAERGELVSGLLAGQQRDGSFGVHPYKKWTGAHWRLVSLVELELPTTDPRLHAALDTVLAWLAALRLPEETAANGLPLIHASQQGNAIAVASRLGRGDAPEVALLVETLLTTQWPDGGWNCSPRAGGGRSSFHETLPAMWGLFEVGEATGNRPAVAAAEHAAELILEHRVYRRHGTAGAIHPSWTVLHYPPYWHYDILQALLVLSRMGLASDPRAVDAIDLLLERRRHDGRWRAGDRWWRPPGTERGNVEARRLGPRGVERDDHTERAAGAEGGRPLVTAAQNA